MKRAQLLALTKLCEEQRLEIERLKDTIAKCEAGMLECMRRTPGDFSWCENCRRFANEEQELYMGVFCNECPAFVCLQCENYFRTKWHFVARKKPIYPQGVEPMRWDYLLCHKCAVEIKANR